MSKRQRRPLRHVFEATECNMVFRALIPTMCCIEVLKLRAVGEETGTPSSDIGHYGRPSLWGELNKPDVSLKMWKLMCYSDVALQIIT